MPGERKLCVRREDAYAMVGGSGDRFDYESGLREVELLRDHLHRLVVEPGRLAKNREGGASERAVREDVNKPVVVAGHLRATDERTSFMKASKTGSLSFGPGAPSGWYW